MSWSKNIKRLIDVCEVIAGQSPEGKYYNKVGQGLPFYQGKKEFTNKEIGEPTTWTTKTTKEAFKGDILMSVRAPVGPINLATQHICIGRGLAAIRASDKVNNDYLFYFLLKHESEIVGNVGAVFNSINKTQIGNIPIPIPLLEEQKQIVAILDKAFASIDQAQANIEKNIKNARELFQSKLNDIFSQKGNGWEEKSLGEVCELNQGLAINAKTKHLLVVKSSLPLLRIKDLKNNTEEQYVSETGYPEKSKVKIGDLIYTRTGSLGLVFRNRYGILHNNSFKVEPIPELSKNYLFWWLQHEAFTKIIIGLASKAAQPDITHKLFKKQTITYPSILEQEKYYSIIEKLNNETIKLESHYQKKLANLEDLKKAILQKAFSGELTQKPVAV